MQVIVWSLFLLLDVATASAKASAAEALPEPATVTFHLESDEAEHESWEEVCKKLGARLELASYGRGIFSSVSCQIVFGKPGSQTQSTPWRIEIIPGTGSTVISAYFRSEVDQGEMTYPVEVFSVSLPWEALKPVEILESAFLDLFASIIADAMPMALWIPRSESVTHQRLASSFTNAGNLGPYIGETLVAYKLLFNPIDREWRRVIVGKMKYSAESRKWRLSFSVETAAESLPPGVWVHSGDGAGKQVSVLGKTAVDILRRYRQRHQGADADIDIGTWSRPSLRLTLLYGRSVLAGYDSYKNAQKLGFDLAISQDDRLAGVALNGEVVPEFQGSTPETSRSYRQQKLTLRKEFVFNHGSRLRTEVFPQIGLAMSRFSVTAKDDVGPDINATETVKSNLALGLGSGLVAVVTPSQNLRLGGSFLCSTASLSPTDTSMLYFAGDVSWNWLPSPYRGTAATYSPSAYIAYEDLSYRNENSNNQTDELTDQIKIDLLYQNIYLGLGLSVFW